MAESKVMYKGTIIHDASVYYAPHKPQMTALNKIIVDEYETFPNYTLAKMKRDIMQQVTLERVEHWCNECKCGKRVNRWTFAFKTAEELTMFKLRWL